MDGQRPTVCRAPGPVLNPFRAEDDRPGPRLADGQRFHAGTFCLESRFIRPRIVVTGSCKSLAIAPHDSPALRRLSTWAASNPDGVAQGVTTTLTLLGAPSGPCLAR